MIESKGFNSQFEELKSFGNTETSVEVDTVKDKCKSIIDGFTKLKGSGQEEVTKKLFKVKKLLEYIETTETKGLSQEDTKRAIKDIFIDTYKQENTEESKPILMEERRTTDEKIKDIKLTKKPINLFETETKDKYKSVSPKFDNYDKHLEKLARKPSDFFKHCVKLKKQKIDSKEIKAIESFISSKGKAAPSEYIAELYFTFKQQFTMKLEKNMTNDQVKYFVDMSFDDFVNMKTERLLLNFLKEKIPDNRTDTKFDLEKEGVELDPHFHLSSVFAKEFPDSKLILPNFDASYEYLRKTTAAKYSSWYTLWYGLDTNAYIEAAEKNMKQLNLSKVTETQVNIDIKSLKLKDRKVIPIVGQKRADTNTKVVNLKDHASCDVCGLEKEKYHSLKKLFKQLSKNNKMGRIHMGETIVPAIGKKHMENFLAEAKKYYKSTAPLRVGHGTHASVESLIKISGKGYFVEACLSSNKKTSIINKRSDYPLGVMLLLGVKVVIATDGGELYGTSLAKEYEYAIKNLNKFHKKIESGSDQVVSLPNGDTLKRKDLLELLKKDIKMDEFVKDGGLDKEVTYADLKTYVRKGVLDNISLDALKANTKELQKSIDIDLQIKDKG